MKTEQELPKIIGIGDVKITGVNELLTTYILESGEILFDSMQIQKMLDGVIEQTRDRFEKRNA